MPNHNITEMIIPIAHMPTGGVLQLKEEEEKKGNTVLYAAENETATKWLIRILNGGNTHAISNG